MQTVTRGLVVAVLAVVLLAPVQAQAAAGCRSGAVEKIDQWSNKVAYSDWHPGEHLPKIFNIKLTGTLLYLYCPRGEKPDKIKPLDFTWCWTHLQDDRGLWFEGVTFNGSIWAVNFHVDPKKKFVSDPSGDMQECRVQNINKTRWLLVWWGVLRARWEVFSKIVKCCGRPDHKHQFKWKGKDYKLLWPKKDPNVSVWYRGE